MYSLSCILPNFTDSFFSCSDSGSGDSSFVLSDYSGLSVSSPGITISPENTIEETLTDSVSEDHCDIFKELRDLKKGNHKKPILCHLNINSLRHKFNDLKPVLIDKLCDILVISETKLDETFNDNLFATKGYKMERKDRNARGGGLMVFYRSDLPVRRIKNYECEESESIFLELKLKNRAWCIPCVYRPPSTNDTTFENDFSTKLDQMLVK